MDPLPFNWGPLKEEHAGSFKVGLQINLKILRHFHVWVFLLIIPIWISAKFNDDKLGEHCGQLESPWIQVISSKCRHRPQSWTIEHHQSSISITNQSIDHNHEQLNIINHQHQCNRCSSSYSLSFSQRPALPGLHYNIRGCHCRESRFYCFIINKLASSKMRKSSKV